MIARMYVDCRGLSGAGDCSVTIAANQERELLETAVEHLVRVHDQRDTPELREALRRQVRIEQAEIEGGPRP